MVRARSRITVAGALAAAGLLLGSCSSSAHRTAGPKTPAMVTTSTTPTTVAAGPGQPAPIRWVPCSGAAGPSGYQCATVQVPRDPQHPTPGDTISMAIDRRRASGPKMGSLLVNPGGPGGSGVDFLPDAVSFLGKDVRSHFDVVGFDPPGVARTAPITCMSGPQLDEYYGSDPAPTTAAGLAAYVALDKLFAVGCQARSGQELPHVSTVDAAMDMDVLRAALGDQKLTYLGFSYGTFLGATYANLFPTRVRAMVLDGALDPSQPVIAGLDRQSAAFDADLAAALNACAQDSSCPWRVTGDPVAAYRALLDRVTKVPLAVAGTSRTVGAAAFLYGTALTLYNTKYWPDLYRALAGVAQGDGHVMLELFDSYTGRNADGSYSNELESNSAVNCLDAAPPSLAAIQAALPEAEKSAPVFGPSDLLSEVQCVYWPIQSSRSPAPIHAEGSAPIVVVGTTGDPATPYQDAVALAGQLQHGVLVTRVGEGHTAYPYSSCIRSHVDAYLLQLTVPAEGIRCATD